MKLAQILKPADILHVRGSAIFPSRAIRWCLGNTWANHDALAIEYNGLIRIGETEPPWSRLVSIESYQKDIDAGKIAVRVYRVPNLDAADAYLIGDWWIENVLGRLYDFMAYPRLIGKCAVNAFLNAIGRKDKWRELINTPAGWKWAAWCTEGVVQAYRSRGIDICPGVANPTPLHIEQAERAGRITLVWGSKQS